MKEVKLYEKLGEGRVRCFTCAHECRIGDGKRGVCGVRENREGALYSLVYGKAIALHVDPIEKKPLFHFYPGTKSFSMATVGCNMRCLNCQNSDISQMPRDGNRIDGQDVSPAQIVRAASDQRCVSISYNTLISIIHAYLGRWHTHVACKHAVILPSAATHCLSH